MGLIGQQFGKPSGVWGELAGRFMATSNAGMNRWVAAQAIGAAQPDRVLEIGSGPGVGTATLLDAAPAATLTAVDPSPGMVRQLARRNREAIESGRLEVRRARLKDVDDVASYDLAIAVHVLYFWTDPHGEMQRIHDLLRPGGVAAIGYQLRHHMPSVAQRDFPATGHRLYDADAEVADIMTRAHLECLTVRIMGQESAPTGRLLMATRAT